jgi:CheY-like chemotaxis protein
MANSPVGIRSDIMQQSACETGRLDIQEDAREMVEFQSGDETPRMLIADDDPSIVGLLADHCARLGFDVDTASNGIQAFLKTRRVKPDILVIDVNMPEVDGLSVCARLLDLDRMPVNVIVITGSRDPDTRGRCEGLGAYYARKGPDFWTDLEAALAEIYPRLAGRIWQAGAHAPASGVIGRRFGLGKLL